MLPPIQHLIDEYEAANSAHDYRAIAETCYALAIRMRDDGEFKLAQHYARESLAAARRLPTTTLDDVVTRRQEVGGIPLPGIFHDDVIRLRLEGLLNNGVIP